MMQTVTTHVIDSTLLLLCQYTGFHFYGDFLWNQVFVDNFVHIFYVNDRDIIVSLVKRGHWHLATIRDYKANLLSIELIMKTENW